MVDQNETHSITYSQATLILDIVVTIVVLLVIKSNSIGIKKSLEELKGQSLTLL